MSRISNRQVVEELKRGDRRGYQHLVELYQRLLIHESMRVSRIDRRDAEELVSDVLLAIIQKIDQFSFRKSESDFHYWVMAVYRNKVRDYFRRRVSAEGMIALFSDPAVVDGHEEPGANPVVISLLNERAVSVLGNGEDCHSETCFERRLDAMGELLEKLEVWERILVRCRALDVPFEEIARYTGKPVSQLKVYHPRVKKKLMRLFTKHYPELQPV